MASEKKSELVLAITEAAIGKIEGFRAQSDDPESEALWVEVNGDSGGKYTYRITLDAPGKAGADDKVERHRDLTVVIPASSVAKLRGATLDWAENETEAGLEVVNPNRPPKPPAPQPLPMADLPMAPSNPPASPAMNSRPPADLSGDVAQRVIQVLDRQVNPAIASHGGHAQLVAVEEEVAYLRLGGGCQGCGMATVTLSQGIEVAIIESVPEITRVVDVTDHAAGANPYFEAAKK